MNQGPVVSVVQIETPTRPYTRFGFDKNLMLRDLIKFGDQAMQSMTKPDLIVWPEASFETPMSLIAFDGSGDCFGFK